jgi:sigma-B regulation protein RsbU (phosphoserine phosphatase)
MDELELRLAARHAIGHELSLRKQAERMARALQESLLPPKLPQILGAEIAALYRPADAGIVGGDFYDVFEVDGTWVLAVGDVSGKGPEAAALTGLARHTIRTGALTATSPADVLRTLNEVMFLDCPHGHTAHFCTVLLIFAHPAPDGLSITVAAGGHPPGLILHGDHSQSSVGAPGTPAGVFPELQVTDVTGKLGHGDALVLFTDGLTEARTPAGLLGIEGVQRALRHAGERSASGIVADLQELTSGPEVRVRDDVAALVLKVL